jgi:hypothetical protein
LKIIPAQHSTLRPKIKVTKGLVPHPSLPHLFRFALGGEKSMNCRYEYSEVQTDESVHQSFLGFLFYSVWWFFRVIGSVLVCISSLLIALFMASGYLLIILIGAVPIYLMIWFLITLILDKI